MADRDIAAELTSRLPGLERLWAITKGRPEVTIAVLDGPADPASVSRTSLAPSGAIEHGTHVYSIISGSSDGVIPGIAPLCTILSIPIFAASSNGTQHICSQEELAAGIRGAIGKGANVINISASQQADLLSLSSDLSRALQESGATDTLVVAAAGNQGCACDTIPASVPGVLAVGAHDDEGAPLLSSNWGPNQRAQGITAPGTGVPGACVGGGLCRASGTRFATATVSGVAALLMSADVARGLRPSGKRTRRLLLDSCVPPPPGEIEMASKHLAGRMDVSRAVDLVGGLSASASKGEETLTTSSLPKIEGAQPQGATGTVTIPTVEEESRAVRNASARGVAPADCSCGCGGTGNECTCADGPAKPQLVYAIGRIGVTFVSQARRDSLWRRVNAKESDLKFLTDANLQELFEVHPYEAQSVVWTLGRAEVPTYIYAILPAGAFASDAYKFLVEQWSKKVEFISLPGVLAGQVALYDGQIVDAVIPDLRGMFSWTTEAYVKSLRSGLKRKKSDMEDAEIEREMKRFFGKIYYSVRNRGLSPEERAINAAATNAFNVSNFIAEAGQEGMALRDVGVERSSLSRPGSDYYDVLLTFFDLRSKGERAALRARLTVDVSDTVPVVIGEPVAWHEY